MRCEWMRHVRCIDGLDATRHLSLEFRIRITAERVSKRLVAHWQAHFYKPGAKQIYRYRSAFGERIGDKSPLNLAENRPFVAP